MAKKNLSCVYIFIPFKHSNDFLRAFLLPILLLILPFNVQSSLFEDYLIDPEDHMLDGSRYLSEVPYGFLPIPVIITEPAVDGGLGLIGVFFNESDDEKKQRIEISRETNNFILPKNISVIALGATGNDSKFLGGGHMGFWYNDHLRYQGFVGYAEVNLDFYSLDGIELPNPVELNIVGPAVLQNLKLRISDSNWFIGVNQLYRKVETNLESGVLPNFITNPVAQQKLQAFVANFFNQDITTSGLGMHLEYDSRNNPMNASQGFYYAAKFTRFDDNFGSDVDYTSYHAEGLNYFNLSKKFDLGVRLQYDSVNADSGERLPSYVPPFIDLRGVPISRYQGNNVATTEVELTYKLNYRWKLKTFTGVGRAANSYSELSDADNIDNYGVGFRYLLAKRYGFDMGIDIARGPEDTAFYIQAGSPW